MEVLKVPTETGFSFENCSRNHYLASKLNYELPSVRKTGTTIVGLIYKDGVILGADTRATEGDIVADKNCSKIHYLAPNIFCCGAGTAADTEMTTRMISSQLDLHQLETARASRVITAKTLLKQKLFKYQGYISAALVLGGVDVTGPHVHSIYPHGSTDELPYVTMGSGSLAAMAVLESGWKPEMELDEAKELMSQAVSGGIFNDLGSGSNVDMCVISKDNKVDFIRPYHIANKKGERVGKYSVPEGCTKVASSRDIPLEDAGGQAAEEQMDIADE